MRALVVYESMFGNTEEVARAVAAGISSHLDVDVEVEAVGEGFELPTELDLIVAGAPTHAFSLPRDATREDAVRQGAHQGAVHHGLREWLEHLGTDGCTVPVATFDTRVAKVRHLPGSAARKADRIAGRRGHPRAAAPESFYVADVKGPLLAGEVERARLWGERLGAEVASATAPSDSGV
jgi:hypothetical protein